MFKKSFVVIIATFLLVIIPFSVCAAGISYTDSETNISFTLPEGWKETSVREDREFVKVKYTHNTDDGSTILFGYGDIWSQLTESERAEYNREDINHNAMRELFSNEELAQTFGINIQDSIIEEVSYNWKEYVKITSTSQINLSGYSSDITLIYLMHIQEGYMFIFGYGYLGEDIHGQDFEDFMNKVKYSDIYSFTHDGEEIIIPNIDDLPSIEVPSYVTDLEDYNYDNDYDYDYDTTKRDNGILYFEDGELKFDFILFIFSLIITIVVYSLPIIIYRYAIKKQPLHEKKAKKIVIIYGIFAFLIMAVLTGGHVGAAIILWSTINYKMLTKPSKRDVYNYYTNNPDEQNSSFQQPVTSLPITLNIAGVTEQPRNGKTQAFKQQEIFKLPKQETDVVKSSTPNEITPQSDDINRVNFCCKCGTRLTVGGEFCHKCGTKIVR